MRRSRVAVPLTAIVLAAGGGAWALQGRPGPAASRDEDRIAPASYSTFTDCRSLLDYLRGHARPLVGPYGLDAGLGVDGGAVGVFSGGSAVPKAGAPQEAVPGAAASASAGAGTTAGTTSDTGTNVQVAGVDEADVSKRSGDLVLTVSGKQQGLTVLRTSGDSARIVGRLDPGWRPSELLVDGNSALLLGSVPVAPPPAKPPVGAPERPGYALPPGIFVQRTRIAEVDIADPAHPRLVRTLDVDGSSVGARLAGGVLRLALLTRPYRLPVVVPQVRGAVDGTTMAKVMAAALARNRAIIAASTLDKWLPRYTLTPAGGRASSGSLLDCGSIGVPDRFSGLGTLALLTFDLRTQGVSRWKGAGVLAGGTTLYSTGDHTYVATSAWYPVPVVPPGAAAGSSGSGGVAGEAGASSVSPSVPKPPTITPEPARTVPKPPAGSLPKPPTTIPDLPTIAPEPATTEIHAFSTTAAGVRYLGSGNVDGRLLDQYSLDEYQGRLRVATTTGPAWGIERPLAAPAPAIGVAGSAGGAGSGAASGGGGSSAAGSGAAGPGGGGASGAAPGDPGPRPMQVNTTSAVTVLQLRAGRLVRVGHVGGLGAGETIRAVRFAGPAGYVVTFRQTDPLYTLDLSDPTHPVVAGQLKLLGYSAYLHPLGDGLLLGVGQDASADGAVQGVLVSLFDVADPAHPRLVDRVTVPGSWAGTEVDPHAFAYAGDLALVPLGTGMLAVRVEQDRLGTPSVLQLDRTGDISALDPASVRAFLDGDILWTVAPGPARAVLAAHDATSLTWLSAVSF